MKNVFNLKTMPFKKKNLRTWYKKVEGENTEIVYWFFKKGAIVGPHHHVAEQITFIMSGEAKVTMNGKEIILRENDILHIPPNVTHKFEFTKDTVDLDVFSPIKSNLE